jgi:hypothetical protein
MGQLQTSDSRVTMAAYDQEIPKEKREGWLGQRLREIDE